MIIVMEEITEAMDTITEVTAIVMGATVTMEDITTGVKVMITITLMRDMTMEVMEDMEEMKDMDTITEAEVQGILMVLSVTTIIKEGAILNLLINMEMDTIMVMKAKCQL